MPNNDEVVFPNNHNIEGSLDLSDTNNKLDELLNLIKSDLEKKEKKEKENEKKFEEEQKLLEEQQLLEEEELLLEKENSEKVVETIMEDVSNLESINSFIEESVFLQKINFVGFGVLIALFTVLIFQHSFKR